VSDTAHAVSADVTAAVHLVQRLSPDLSGEALWNAVAVVLVHVREGRRQAHLPAPDYPTSDVHASPEPPAGVEGVAPPCPVCKGPMRRVLKTNPKMPDYRCMDRQCDKAVWLDRKRRNGA
jgi:hypothetical protein